MHIKTIITALTLLAITQPIQAKTRSYYLSAECHDSYIKYGPDAEDLTKAQGQPITCDKAIISFFDDGGVFVQVFDSNGDSTPLGFVGDALSQRGDMAVLSLRKILLPHDFKGPPSSVEGIKGTCFFGSNSKEGTFTDFSCAAKVDLGGSRLVYHLDVNVGKSELVK